MQMREITIKYVHVLTRSHILFQLPNQYAIQHTDYVLYSARHYIGVKKTIKKENIQLSAVKRTKLRTSSAYLLSEKNATIIQRK